MNPRGVPVKKPPAPLPIKKLHLRTINNVQHSYITQNLEPMKKLLIIAAAILTLAACTKEDSTKWIDGTQWRYSKTDGSHKVNVSLTLRNSGNLTITDQNSWYWNDKFEYQVKSYTYDGDKSGAIELRSVNYYAEDNAAANFTLNYNNEKMSISTPNGSYTLDRTK